MHLFIALLPQRRSVIDSCKGFSSKAWLGVKLEEQLKRDTLFVALTRPQMFAGVTYTFFIINAIIAVEFFLVFEAWWVLLVAVAIHGVGMIACLKEPRIFDLWLMRVRNCPRVKNYGLWKCNSYRP